MIDVLRYENQWGFTVIRYFGMSCMWKKIKTGLFFDLQEFVQFKTYGIINMNI